jgi:hypothetical protein
MGGSDTLSVCCVANSPGPFLKAALGPVRELADEIVIAAGGAVCEEDLRHYAELADRLFVIEFEFVERHLAWLHAQCRGDWILRLDGDEIPSPQMLREVRAAMSDRSVSSVYFSRRNLYPTAASYISQDPWYPDFQLRMVRNDGALRFSGLVHSGPGHTPPARFVEAPIYHLALILAGLDARRARADRYEALRPGLTAPTGLPANQMELPEDRPSVVTGAVPAEHRLEIEDVMSARPSPAVLGSVEPQLVSLAVTDEYWSGRALPNSAYSARIGPLGVTAPLRPRERRPFYFRVCNDGTAQWGWDPSVGPFLHVVHRLLDESGTPVADWRPSFFTEVVMPGSQTVVPAHVDAPAQTGCFQLEMRVRHAPGRLFGRSENVELTVRDAGAWGDGGELPPEWTAT